MSRFNLIGGALLGFVAALVGVAFESTVKEKLSAELSEKEYIAPETYLADGSVDKPKHRTIGEFDRRENEQRLEEYKEGSDRLTQNAWGMLAFGLVVSVTKPKYLISVAGGTCFLASALTCGLGPALASIFNQPILGVFAAIGSFLYAGGWVCMALASFRVAGLTEMKNGDV